MPIIDKTIGYMNKGGSGAFDHVQYNPRKTLNNPRDPTPKRVRPVPTGGIKPHHVVHGQSNLQDRVNYTRRLIQSIPGVSAFVASHGGLPVSGWSGIVPFVRTQSGQTIAPVGKEKGIMRFFQK